MVHIPDDDKLAVAAALVPTIAQYERADVHGATVHLGVYYGAYRQQGWSHDVALAACHDVLAHWYRSGPPPRAIQQLGDDTILALKAAVIPVVEGKEQTSIDGALVDAGTQLGVAREAGRSEAGALHAAGVWLAHWYGVENPFPAPPTAQVPGALVGPLRVVGQAIHDDTGPVNPVFCHAGDLFSAFTRDPQGVEAQLDVIASAGYHGVRAWTCLGGHYWVSKDRHVGPQDPGYWDHVRGFFAALQARGLRWMVSQGDVSAMGTDRHGFMAQLGAIAASFGATAAFCDGGNEAWQTGEGDPRVLASMVSAYRAAGGPGLLTLTSPPGEEKHELDAYAIPPADCFDVHGYRGGRVPDKIRHVFSIPYEGKPALKVGVQSEPTGPGPMVSVTDNKHELDDEALALMGAMSLCARQVWVYMSSHGVHWRGPLESQPGFWAVPRLIATLPKDVMTGELFHGGSTWAARRALEAVGETRCDHVALSGGRLVILVYGTPGTHRIPVAQTIEGDWIDPSTGARTATRLTAGSAVDLTFNWGRLFVGRRA